MNKESRYALKHNVWGVSAQNNSLKTGHNRKFHSIVPKMAQYKSKLLTLTPINVIMYIKKLSLQKGEANER